MTLAKPEQIVDEAYLDFIRSKSCLICSKRPVDADHLMARGRGSANRNDYSAIPLCREHHTERHAIGDSKLEAKYKINLWKECWRLTSAWATAHADGIANIFV